MLSRNYKILIVDDEPEFHQHIRYAFRKNFIFEGATSIPKLEKKLKEDSEYDLILLDLVLDSTTGEKEGMSLIAVLKENLPDTPIIVVTNSNEVEVAVKAGQLGAFSFLYKGNYDYESWIKVFKEALESNFESKAVKKELKQHPQKESYSNPDDFPLIGTSPAMEKIKRTLKILANRPDMTVLITGETGVGKGVAARFLHHNSPSRKDHPFEEIHISNITQSLLESTLFGAKKGSFTGAKEDIKGRLHTADKGVVFMDEIGDLDLENQQKLLQFVQSKKIRPMGSTKDIDLDVQIVTATNKNLLEQVAKKEFRLDLYQRLKTFAIEIPPLRERREDIRELLKYFTGKKLPLELETYFEHDVLNYLEQEYEWVGNVRELENAMLSIPVRMEILDVPKATMECLPDDMHPRRSQVAVSVQQQNKESQPTSENLPTNTADTMPPDLSYKEKEAWTTLNAIEEELIKKNGVKKDVAEALNFKSSDHILYRIKTINKKYPHLIKYFDNIKKKYKV